MRGAVDERNRALITISGSNQSGGRYRSIIAWVNTAFDGHLVFSHQRIDELTLESLVETEAILAAAAKKWKAAKKGKGAVVFGTAFAPGID